MKRYITMSLIALMCVYMSVGCATIIHGSSQNIDIRSNPDEAEVWVDGAKMGTTPTRLNLSRKGDYLIKLSKKDYKDVTIKIEGKTSAWLIGNIVFGGIIGCAVDLVTGGAYDLTPETLDINLSKVMAQGLDKIEIPQTAYEHLKQIRVIGEDGSPEVVLDIQQ